MLKLIEKERVGSKVRKRYDTARTPYQRVLESPDVSEGDKERLRQIYLTLNPVALRRTHRPESEETMAAASVTSSLRPHVAKRYYEPSWESRQFVMVDHLHQHISAVELPWNSYLIRTNVFIADIKMPDMSGKQLLREIKEGYPHMAGEVVFITGDTVSRDTGAFLKRSGCSHPTKPFGLDEIRHWWPRKFGHAYRIPREQIAVVPARQILSENPEPM